MFTSQRQLLTPRSKQLAWRTLNQVNPLTLANVGWIALLVPHYAQLLVTKGRIKTKHGQFRLSNLQSRGWHSIKKKENKKKSYQLSISTHPTLSTSPNLRVGNVGIELCFVGLDMVCLGWIRFDRIGLCEVLVHSPFPTFISFSISYFLRPVAKPRWAKSERGKGQSLTYAKETISFQEDFALTMSPTKVNSFKIIVNLYIKSSFLGYRRDFHLTRISFQS